MNEVTKRDAVNFQCEECGREGGQAIFTCPERPSGRCLYVEQWRKKRYNLLSFILGSFLGLLVLVPLLTWGAPAQCILLAAGLILGVIYLVRPEKVLLYNSNSGVRLQRTTLLGLELSCKWATSGKPVPIDLELPQPLAYPPALTALPTKSLKVSMKQAVAILRMALIGLLAKGQIQVYHSQIYEFKTWGVLKPVQDVYSIVTTTEFDQARFGGRLEREIKQVLANWSQQKEAKEWPDRPPIYDLVRAIYGTDTGDPKGWLASLVARYAARQGWGKGRPLRKGFFELYATHAKQIQQEREIMKALSKRLHQLHPNFSLALDRQIERGIRSRIEREDGC